MLTTEEFTVGDAIDELDDQIEAIEEARADYEPGTSEYETLTARTDRLSHWREGLNWHVAEGDWGRETTLEIGAMSAGEEAMMHRDISSNSEEAERRLWFVAASTVEAPFVGDDRSETFQQLSADVHPGAAKYLEAKANSLGIASDEGNESRTSSTATETVARSPQPSDSTT